MPPPAAPKPKKPAAEIPDVEPRDEIYFRHAGGHANGKVLSRGGHGCFVSVAGKRVKVRWEDFLGHKVRVQADAKVVNKGEDGFLVESKGGHRRFVRDPMGVLDPLAPEEPVHKAMPIVLLMGTADELAKAAGGGGPVKNRPGLVLKPVTDSRGRQTKRWVRASQDPPGKHNLGHGHGVKFHHQGAHHEGTVNGEPGEHGVHVDDAAGRQHQVRYDQISHHAPPSGGGGRDGGGEPPAGNGAAADEPDHETFFTEEETRGLPRKARQPYDTWEELEKHGAEGQKQFEEILGKVGAKLNLRTDKNPKEMTDADWESPDGHLFVGKLKEKDRAERKVDGEYLGDWSKVTDMIRGTISVASFAELRAAIKEVKAAGLTLQQRPKDKFAEPTHAGYRDLLTIVKLPNGMLAELQYHLKPITAAKAKLHSVYKEMGDVLKKYPGDEHPNDNWSDEDHAVFHDTVKRQRQGYDAAWKKAGGRG